MTIEDPIEYLHPHKNCLVNQREVGADTRSFKTALKYILRQDPDVVLVGEMRDLETIEAALVIAETGHSCFGTLHTNSAIQTINRVLDVFPPYQQPQVRAQLSFVLEGVMSQALIAKAGGAGRVMAIEIMIPNPAIRNLIREDKVHQIYSSMQVGQAKFGMQTFNQALAALLQKRVITQDEAFGRSSDTEELRNILASTGQAETYLAQARASGRAKRATAGLKEARRFEVRVQCRAHLQEASSRTPWPLQPPQQNPSIYRPPSRRRSFGFGKPRPRAVKSRRARWRGRTPRPSTQGSSSWG